MSSQVQNSVCCRCPSPWAADHVSSRHAANIEYMGEVYETLSKLLNAVCKEHPQVGTHHAFECRSAAAREWLRLCTADALRPSGQCPAEVNLLSVERGLMWWCHPAAGPLCGEPRHQGLRVLRAQPAGPVSAGLPAVPARHPALWLIAAVIPASPACVGAAAAASCQPV